MKNQPLKNIQTILQNSSLASMVKRCNELQEMTLKIQQRLPTPYRHLYRVRNLYDNCLVIEVQNAVVRQGLLLQQNQLLPLIQLDFPQVNQLEFKVNPNFKSIS